MAEQILIV